MTDDSSSNELDIWDYVRFKKLELAKSLGEKKVIFLDLNYWINLRDVNNGTSNNECFTELLSVARELVSSGKCVFPITDSMFHEMRKQSGDRLNDTVALVDELSDGICVEERDQRINFELLYFLQQDPTVEKYTAKELLWTKTYFIFHNALPFNEELSPEAEAAFQKDFVDFSWEQKFGDFTAMFQDFDDFTGAVFEDKSDILNEGKNNHTDEYSNFHDLFLNEVSGSIDVLKDSIIDSFAFLYQKSSGNVMGDDDKTNYWNDRSLQKLIYNVFRVKKDEAGKLLPYINIMSGCHAAVRWEPTLQYEGNHAFDFEHACCALPYADYFFTERQLKHLVTQNQLAFDKLYECEVIARPSEALEALKKII